jgi:predicted  nucleic acid-binding Zn-ribbon protein
LKEEIILKDRIKLLEKEIGTLTDKLETLNDALKGMDDLKQEIKGIKLFLVREYPEFKNKFPEIMQKIYKNKK